MIFNQFIKESEVNFMAEEKDIYFLTMDNISDYNIDEGKKLSDEELIERVKLNFRLFQKNDVLEKKKLLLNNCLITFKSFEKDIPADLLFPVYYELIKLNSLEEANDLLLVLYEKYNTFSLEDKNKYASKFLEVAYLISKTAYQQEQFELLVDTISMIKKVYQETEKNDESNLVFANSLALYGNLYCAIDQLDKAESLLNNALYIIDTISDNCPGKIENLAYIDFMMGNILFQGDKCEQAKEYFEKSRNICLSNDFSSKFELMHISYNYLSQVEVYEKDYGKAIATINEYFEKSKDIYSGDKYDYICADFYYRIGIIYQKFKNDGSQSQEYMKLAREKLENIKNKDDEAKDFLKTLNKIIK